MKELFIGIDVGGTRTKYGLVEAATDEVHENEVLPTHKEDETAFLKQVCGTVDLFQHEERLAVDKNDAHCVADERMATQPGRPEKPLPVTQK